jgi:predicted MFS family arabinose efflux permease
VKQLAQNTQQDRTKWGVLILAAISMGLVIGIPMSSMPVLFTEISKELNLNSVQVGSIWGIISFGSIFVTLIGGIVSDRLGYKRSIIILGVICGLAGASRGLSNGFTSILITTMVWGFIGSAMSPALSMIVSVFATKQRQVLAQALMATGGALGLAVGSMISATVLSPLLGGWRNVFFFLGAVAILSSLSWIFAVRHPTENQQTVQNQPTSFRKAMGYLFRLKPFWIIALSFMAYQGCILGMQGYIAYFLEDHGWTTLSASGVLTVFNLVGAIFAVPIALHSDKMGSRKNYLAWAFITVIIGVGLLSVVHNELVWILVILAGIFGFVTLAIYLTLCIEILSKKAAYIGTAIGLILSISNIGRSVAPPIGNSLADLSSSIAWPFIFWTVLGIAGAILLIFIKEPNHLKQSQKN